MPLSVFMKLGSGEPKATTVSLQLVDWSIKYPMGVEDVLVKVDKLIFSIDFLIFDIEEAHSKHYCHTNPHFKGILENKFQSTKGDLRSPWSWVIVFKNSNCGL